MRRVRERLQRDGLVTLDGLGDRSAVVKFARSVMAMTPHRDSEPDGLTVIRDTGRHADRPGFAGLGSGEVLPHTEGSGTPAPPRLLLLACSQVAQSGGVSTLVDGAAVLAELCACRLSHPARSSGMPVLVDHSAEPVVSAYVQAGDSPGIGDRFGDRAQGRCLVHGLVGPVPVVVVLELAQGVA